MTKRYFTVFIIITCIFSCAHAYAGWARLSKSTIQLKGDIEKGSYGQYLAAAKGGFSRVTLDSAGGYPSVALKIARDIQQHEGIEVTVDGVCISACASYLAIAGRSLKIDCDSVIGWHGTLGDPESEMRSMRVEGVPDGLIVEYGKWLKSFHSKEANFYKRAGVDLSILKDSVAAVNDLNSAETYSLDTTTGEYSYSTSAAIWVPSMSSLKKYGIRNLEYCKEYDASQVKSILKSHGYSVHFSTRVFR